MLSPTLKIGSIQLKVTFKGKPDKEVQANAYAFNRDGTFITNALFKDGLVQLNISQAQTGQPPSLILFNIYKNQLREE